MELFYALIVVCAGSVTPCDVEHAIWASQSDPVWETSDECFEKARDYVQTQDLSKYHGIGPGETIRIEITCEKTAKEG